MDGRKNSTFSAIEMCQDKSIQFTNKRGLLIQLTEKFKKMLLLSFSSALYCAAVRTSTFLPIMNCIGDYYVLGSNHLYALLQKGFFPIIPHQHQAHVSARSKKLYLWRAEKWFWRGSLLPFLLDIDVWLTVLPCSYNHLFMKFKFSSRKLLYPFRRLAF